VELLICRDGEVEARSSENVAGDLCLFGEVVPQLEGEVRIGCAETTDEVILKCLNGTLCRVCSVIVGFDELDLSAPGGHEGLDCGRGLIVSDGESGFEAMGFEAVVYRGKRVHNVLCCGRFDGDCKDVIRVVGIGHKEELLAVQGAGGKVPGAVCVERVGLFVGECCIAEDVCCRVVCRCGLCCGGTSGAAVASGAELEAALCGGRRFLEVCVDEVWG